jgi:hypothetical protein
MDHFDQSFTMIKMGKTLGKSCFLPVIGLSGEEEFVVST